MLEFLRISIEPSVNNKEYPIAKNRNTYAKRQREQEKRQRADDKRIKRERKSSHLGTGENAPDTSSEAISQLISENLQESVKSSLSE